MAVVNMLRDDLSEKKNSILKRWLNLIGQTHPEGGANFLKDKDRFTNPVGYTISSAINVLYEELLQDRLPSERVLTSLDDINMVRAVQNFSPRQAVAIVFLLKKAIRAEIGDEIREKREFEELLKFESRIDELALYAFNSYMDCREKIYKVKVDEMKAERDNAFRLIERTSLRFEGLEHGVVGGNNGRETVE